MNAKPPCISGCNPPASLHSLSKASTTSNGTYRTRLWSAAKSMRWISPLFNRNKWKMTRTINQSTKHTRIVLNWLIDSFIDRLYLLCFSFLSFHFISFHLKKIQIHGNTDQIFFVYLSTWDLQNGRREFSSIIRCMPMSEIKTADSMATHSIHNNMNVVTRKLVILIENKRRKETTIYHRIHLEIRQINCSSQIQRFRFHNNHNSYFLLSDEWTDSRRLNCLCWRISCRFFLQTKVKKQTQQ